MQRIEIIENSVIEKTIGYVMHYGPLFEVELMARKRQDPRFQFLYDKVTYSNKSIENKYYRWKLLTILHGQDTGPIQIDGVWMLPPELPFDESPISDQDSDSDTELQATPIRRITRLLQHVHSKESIGQVMFYAILYSQSADRILDLIIASIVSPVIAIPTRISRFYVLHDILANSSSAYPNAWKYRLSMETRLAFFIKKLVQIVSKSGRLSQEQFKNRVFVCLDLWKDWDLYSSEFIQDLKAEFAVKKVESVSVAEIRSVVPEPEGLDTTREAIITPVVPKQSPFKAIPLKRVSQSTIFQKVPRPIPDDDDILIAKPKKKLLTFNLKSTINISSPAVSFESTTNSDIASKPLEPNQTIAIDIKEHITITPIQKETNELTDVLNCEKEEILEPDPELDGSSLDLESVNDQESIVSTPPPESD